MVTIVVMACVVGLVLFVCSACATKVKAIGRQYERRLTNELAQSTLFLPWTVVDGELTFELADEQVEPMLDRITDVTIQSSVDLTNWDNRTTVRTDPVYWDYLARGIMDADRITTTNPARFYRGAW
jgi:hypothetical protein